MRRVFGLFPMFKPWDVRLGHVRVHGDQKVGVLPVAGIKNVDIAVATITAKKRLCVPRARAKNLDG